MIQLLKAMSFVGSGGEAKECVLDGLVYYNGEVDYRMRLKVRPGDEVVFEGNFIKVV
jgi:ribosome-associated protein|tara:strand:+ start:557 stop:727 length:171 start_codon:yes stop_codon:yes gene_type:complete